ncbi:hypothetical protein ACQZ44_02520 [Agrobacterium vitis]
MIWWVGELLRSVRFLSASGQESFWRSKRVYEFVIPSAFSGLIAFIAFLFPKVLVPDILQKLSSGLFQFMVFVVPFHLAALAAIATFSRPELDAPLKGDNVELKVWDNKQSEYFLKSLTLRQYTCLLFGYLCSIGMGYILVYIISSGVDTTWLLGSWSSHINHIAVFILLFFLAHYGTLTIYAVTFFFDKVSDIESH